jgi:hypothetical protein
MSLTLMHLANHGGKNIGNAALIDGVETLLQEDVPGDVAFVPEPWDLYSRRKRTFDDTFVDRVNREVDALLVGAAVTFDGSSLYANSGFRLDLPLAAWDRFEKPVVFYGLSYRNWPTWRYHHRDALRAAIERIVGDERMLFSVRNDGTREWLEGLTGVRSERIHVVPDPGVFVQTDDSFHPELDPNATNVIVAPNAEDEMPRYGRAPRRRTVRRPRLSSDPRDLLPLSSSWGWRETRARLLGDLAEALRRIAADCDVNLIFCAHDDFDIGMCHELFWLLPDDVRQRAVFASASLSNAQGRYFYDLYAKADLVLSMRVHSMNPAVGLGTPLVPIVSQDRMSAFMADAGLEDLTVDLHADDLAAAVHAKATAALAAPDALRARLGEARARLRQRAAAFDARVAEHLELHG